MTNNPPSRATKKAALRDLIREAVNEQQNPARDPSVPFSEDPFESRVNQTFWRVKLADTLKMTDALEILGELVDDAMAGE